MKKFFLKHSFIGAVNFNVMNGMNSNQMNIIHNDNIINQNYNITDDQNQMNNYDIFCDKLEDVLSSLCRVYKVHNSTENDSEYNLYRKNSNIIDNDIIQEDNDSEKNDEEYSFYKNFIYEDLNEHYNNSYENPSKKKIYFTLPDKKIKKKLSNNFNNDFIKNFNVSNLLQTSIHDLGIIFYSNNNKSNIQLEEENTKLDKDIYEYLYNKNKEGIKIKIKNKKENNIQENIFYKLINYGKRNRNRNGNKKGIGFFIKFIEFINELRSLDKIGDYIKLLNFNNSIDDIDIKSITLNDVFKSAYTKYTNTQKKIENSIKKSFINNAEDFMKYIPTNYLDIEEVLPNIKKTYFYFNCKAFEPLIKDVYKIYIKDLYNLNHITSKYEDVPFSDKQINLLKNLYYYDFYNFINDTLTSENYYESFKEKILDIFEDFPNAKITNYIKNFIEKEYNDDFVNTLKYKKVSFNEFCSIYESISNKYEPVVTPRNFIEVTFDKNFIKEEYKRLYLNA